MAYSLPTHLELDPSALFPFPLDSFQLQAIAALNADKSVVVCAPTGSGKTLIGEYAIYRALHRGRRVFYTTPLKALSNQKLRDFREQFGAENVGLLTGDMSMNREAPIVVMTTEIFRNMLYGTPIGEVGTSLEGLETVVLDECHYMNDRQRGTVWEESVIYCPREIQLVALSATIANSDQLTDWINDVHGPTELVYSDYRPVPLDFHFCTRVGKDEALLPLLQNSGTRINSRLIRRRPITHPVSATEVVMQMKQDDLLPAIYFIFSRRGCDRAVNDLMQADVSLVTPAEVAQLKQYIDQFREDNPNLDSFRPDMLEALYRGIASHHAGVLPAWKALTEELFQQALIKVVFATETLSTGINMPARTTVISSLYKRTDEGFRLLKASEFLQMAGRGGRRGMDVIGHSVVMNVPMDQKRTKNYMAYLERIATAGAEPLESRFAPSYGMVLNLLQRHTIEEAKELVERSFGQYLSTLDLKPKQQEIQQLKAELQDLEQTFNCSADQPLETLAEEFSSYTKLQERLRQEKNLLRTLEQQAEEVRTHQMAAALVSVPVGTVLSLQGKHVSSKIANPVTGVLVAQMPSPGRAPYLLCLAQDNRWYVLAAADVVALHESLPRLTLVDHLEIPEIPAKLGQRRRGDELSQAVVQQLPQAGVTAIAPEVQAQQDLINILDTQLSTHPLTGWGEPRKLLKRWEKWQNLQAQIQRSEADLHQSRQRYWDEFLKVIAVLKQFDCLENPVSWWLRLNCRCANLDDPFCLEMTYALIELSLSYGITNYTVLPLGQATAALRGDNELWLGLALMSGEFDRLEPAQLAAACAALVTEISRPDTSVYYSLSETAQNALNRLWSRRKALIKVQRRFGVECLILPERWEDRRISALVERWAAGATWQEIVAKTSLDDGDIVRMLRRTLDFLSQVPHVPRLSHRLRKHAAIARQLLDRFPVNEAAG
ncbi:MAG: DEAD/DEAH box helicase [Oscillatoriales cyanobacterium RM2_1_1]|nr:DEAD/DEAH box helicase [Oscillatoriales cyanobacterium SM2_3_0]NJO44594.1 DEAD/DEAH box helicase [Oscillatoriales cyanobacterium RM2_1_1]